MVVEEEEDTKHTPAFCQPSRRLSRRPPDQRETNQMVRRAKCPTFLKGKAIPRKESAYVQR